MIHFVGAGSGAEDLITLRGARHLEEADVVIYAGSLVNPALLKRCRPGCEIHDSASMTLEEVLAVMDAAEAAGKTTVRLHTGDPQDLGITVDAASVEAYSDWYTYSNAGMGVCLTMAEELGAYILSDKATFLTFQANNGAME